ncbi:TPA: hypothetical protein ACTZ3A_001486 [Bacillus cereus]
MKYIKTPIIGIIGLLFIFSVLAGCELEQPPNQKPFTQETLNSVVEQGSLTFNQIKESKVDKRGSNKYYYSFFVSNDSMKDADGNQQFKNFQFQGGEDLINILYSDKVQNRQLTIKLDAKKENVLFYLMIPKEDKNPIFNTVIDSTKVENTSNSDASNEALQTYFNYKIMDKALNGK